MANRLALHLACIAGSVSDTVMFPLDAETANIGADVTYIGP